MKKILSIIIIAFLLSGNIAFAEFSIETKLSVQKQESYKKQIDSVYKNFENKLSKFNEEKQIKSIEKINGKIDILFKNKLSDKNSFVLSYLSYLLKEKLDFLKSNDDINILDVLKVEDEKINKEITCKSGTHKEGNKCVEDIKYCNIANGTGIQKWNLTKWYECMPNKCNNGYINKDGETCSKIIIEEKKIPKVETSIKKCYGKNWIGEEKITLIDGVKQTSPGCKFIKCNDGYENRNGICIKKQVQIICNRNEHIENNSCVSNTRSCNVDNGVGEQNWVGNFWTLCLVKSCNEGYESMNGVCVKKCDLGYRNNNGACESICSENQHFENNRCVSNIKQCNVDGGKGEQLFTNGNWGECIVNYCNFGYSLDNNKCNYTKPYFTFFNDSVGNNISKLNNINNNYLDFTVNISDVININLGTNNQNGNEIICQTVISYYTDIGNKTESKTLGNCTSGYLNNLNIKENHSKINISIFIKEGTLSNMNQLYQSFGATSDRLNLTYNIIK